MKQKTGIANFSLKGKWISAIALVMVVLAMVSVLIPIIVTEEKAISALQLIINDLTNFMSFYYYIQFIVSALVLIYLLSKILLSSERSAVGAAFISIGISVVMAFIHRHIEVIIKNSSYQTYYLKISLLSPPENTFNVATVLLALQLVLAVIAIVFVFTNGYVTELAINSGYDVSKERSKEVKSRVEFEKNSVEILREYKSLLDSGIISQEEFERKKEQVLK